MLCQFWMRDHHAYKDETCTVDSLQVHMMGHKQQLAHCWWQSFSLWLHILELDGDVPEQHQELLGSGRVRPAAVCLGVACIEWGKG